MLRKASLGTLCHLRVLATGGPFYPLRAAEQPTRKIEGVGESTAERESERASEGGGVDRRFIYCYVNLTNEANEA